MGSLDHKSTADRQICRYSTHKSRILNKERSGKERICASNPNIEGAFNYATVDSTCDGPKDPTDSGEMDGPRAEHEIFAGYLKGPYPKGGSGKRVTTRSLHDDVVPGRCLTAVVRLSWYLCFDICR